MIALEIVVNRDESTVEIWLSRADKQDKALRAALTPMLMGYKKSRYTVAVFQSGDGELSQGAEELLLRNIACSAE